MFTPITVRFGTPNIETAKEHVFGREELANQLWKDLSAGSVRLLSERRMGKTWLLMLAMATRPEWAIPLFFDAEGCASAPEFIWKLNEVLHESKLVDTEWKKRITRLVSPRRATYPRTKRSRCGNSGNRVLA